MNFQFFTIFFTLLTRHSDNSRSTGRMWPNCQRLQIEGGIGWRHPEENWGTTIWRRSLCSLLPNAWTRWHL